MATPTLIGMPEPPSNPDTPTEAPGTPNSTTTSLSALSTTAIKDGQRGALPSHGHHHTPSSNTLEAERADRISRLAGLERVSTVRPPNPNLPAAAQVQGGPGQLGPGAGGYFDQNGNPIYTTKMSTVGSASATGSIGGRTTTWASGSAKGADDEDQMSMDTNYRDEADRYSDMDRDADGMSDDTSLVGFGEGAGSTVSGPTYNRRDLANSPAIGRSALASASGPATPTSVAGREARMIDGLADDTASGGYVDTAARDGRGVPVTQSRNSGVEAAERIVRERLDDGEGRKPPLGSPDEAGLGKFYFEEKK